jgi:hypothetical protein
VSVNQDGIGPVLRVQEPFSSGQLGPAGGKTKELPMSRYLLAAALAAVVAGPALAQSTTTTTEYYVVQDASTKKCTIVDKKPTTTTTVQVGPMAFKTRQEAESGIKTIKVCETK